MLKLPVGIQTLQVESVNGLSMHVLTAGQPENPCVVLLHGFPDLAYGWRHVMPLLADQGYYVLAPDQRGYGNTTGWTADYDGNIRPFGMQNLVTDLVSLLMKLEIKQVHCLVGHDFGSPVAAYTSLFREDLIDRLVLMSAPFPGAPKPELSAFDLDVGLSELNPPRKHYQAYHSGRTANRDMLECSQGLTTFLRAYFHMKSADWVENAPFALLKWSAEELAKMPNYYIMPANLTMPEVVSKEFPHEQCIWLNDEELAVYIDAFTRTEFQGALNWYRCSSDPVLRAELGILFSKKISTPCWYLAGQADWGTHQTPGALERLKKRACKNFKAAIEIPNAGHWVQQEQAKLTAQHILSICQTDLT